MKGRRTFNSEPELRLAFQVSWQRHSQDKVPLKGFYLRYRRESDTEFQDVSLPATATSYLIAAPGTPPETFRGESRVYVAPSPLTRPPFRAQLVRDQATRVHRGWEGHTRRRSGRHQGAAERRLGGRSAAHHREGECCGAVRPGRAPPRGTH